MTKVCTKCHIEKDISDFYFWLKKQIYHTACKDCGLKAQKERRRKVVKPKTDRSHKRKAIIKNGCRICSTCSINKPLSAYQWTTDNRGNYGPQAQCKECVKIKTKKYLEKEKPHLRPHNKIKRREYRRKYRQRRFKIDINYKILERTRAYIGRALRTLIKSKSTQKLVGCTIQELKSHLESLWTQDMNWKNYGQYGWHIDHIVPCSSFDLKNPKEQEKCFHYPNLRPLWATTEIAIQHGASCDYIGNINKNNKIL